MGLDVVVIRVDRKVPALDQLLEDDAKLPLGVASEVRQLCERYFPGLRWSNPRDGLYVGPEDYGIEFHIPQSGEDVPVRSLHLCIHFGDRWSNDVGDRFEALWKRIYADLGWQAFADNEALYPV